MFSNMNAFKQNTCTYAHILTQKRCQINNSKWVNSQSKY